MSMKPFAYVRPDSLVKAQALLSASRRPKGGGFDLLDLMKKGLLAPEGLVDLGGCGGYGEIHALGGVGMLRVGGGVTLSALAASDLVAAWAPLLADAAGEAATPQVRNRATVAGNLLQRPRCAYFRDPFFPCRRRGGDACPAMEGEHVEGAIFDNSLCCAPHPSNLATALMAAESRVLVLQGVSKEGENVLRELPFDDLLAGPEEDGGSSSRLGDGEVLQAVEVPMAGRTKASAYVEVNHKQSFDWAAVSCAVVLRLGPTGTVSEARIVLGAVSPLPRRATAAEKALVGKAPDEAAAEAAAKAAVEGATPLRDNGYKVRLVRSVVKRAILRAAARA